MKNTATNTATNTDNIVRLAVREIFDSYADKKMEVSDGVLSVLEELDQNPQEFKDVGHAVAYIRAYGRRREIDIFRRSMREVSISDFSDVEGNPLQSVENTPEADIMSVEGQRRLQAIRVLKRIKHEIFRDKNIKKSAKQAFFLYFYRGVPQKNIAERFGVTERTVRNRLKSLKLWRFAERFPELRESLKSVGGANTVFGCDLRAFLSAGGFKAQPPVNWGDSIAWANGGDDRRYIDYKDGRKKNGRHDNVIICKDGRKITLVPTALRKHNKGLSLKPREYYITGRGVDLMTHEKPKFKGGTEPPDFTRQKALKCMGIEPPAEEYEIPPNPFAPWCRQGVRRSKWGL